MQKFDGFKPGKVRQVKVPTAFFNELLPLVDDLAELKVLLFSMWAMQQKEGEFRYLRYDDFVENPALLAGLEYLTADDEDVEATLDAALDQAVERGGLLRVEIDLTDGPEAFYFMNSPTGRTAAESLQAGKWLPGDAANPVEILPERPNIFQLYEANIGSLSPMIAEELKEAEAAFPANWLEEAVRLAVQHNKRGWKYIRAILDRWEREGKDRGLTGRLISRMGKDTSQENTPPSSTIIPTTSGTICERCGQPTICNGLGVISYDVPVGDPRFGKLFRCPNNHVAEDYERQERLRRLSNLGAFADKAFDNFILERPMLTHDESISLQTAFNTAQQFAAQPEGWLLLEGTYGCGKTHLAAAIGNERLRQGDMVLFITVPDLLDHLRSTYGPTSEIGYDEMFDRIRGSQLLILDDLGAEDPSQWSGEKLFQLLNYRYSYHLPTVITTNVDLDRIEGRIRSRLLDEELIRRINIKVPDYRTLIGNQDSKLTNFAHYRDMTLDNFDIRTGLDYENQKNLSYVLEVVRKYAEKPSGWLAITGPYGSGKTHLAAGIANIHLDQRTDAIFTTISDLMDYLRLAFESSTTASLSKRFNTILNVPLLVLDDLRAEQSSAWVREKLFQILEYRYLGKLPTVITTVKNIEELDERIATRLLDTRRCQIIAITAPAYALRIHRPRL